MKKTITLCCMVLISMQFFAQRAYYWQGGASGAWSAATSWNTVRGGATGTAFFSATSVNSITNISTTGTYTSAPSVSITGGGGSGATANANLDANGKISSVTITNGGSGYTSVPTVAFTGGTGGGTATGAAVLTATSVSSITLGMNTGGFSTAPTISFTGGGGSGAAATANLGVNGRISSVTITNGGTGYTSAPTVVFTGGGLTRVIPNVGDTLIFDGRSVSSGSFASSGVSATLSDLLEETIAYLVIIANEAGSPAGRNLTVTLPTGSRILTITNDLLISYSSILNDGGNTLKVGGSVVSGIFNANTTSTSSITHSGAGKIEMTGTNTSNQSVLNASRDNSGSGYTSAPTVVVGTPWAASTTFTAGQQIFYGPTNSGTNGGSLFTVVTGGTTGDATTAPTTKIGGDFRSGTAVLRWVGFAAKATCGLTGTSLSSLTITCPGSGYASAPAITFTGGGGSGAAATATIIPNAYFLLQAGNVQLDGSSSNYNLCFSGTTTINGTLNIASGANLNLNSRTLQLSGGSGAVANGGGITGAGTISASSNSGTISFQGSGTTTASSTLNFGTNQSLNTLINNRTGSTVTLASNLTVGTATLTLGALTVNAGKQLTVNTALSNSGTLSLLSDNSSATATILTPATLVGSGSYSVQQYLGTARNWYVSSPVASTLSTITDMSKYFEYVEPGTNNPTGQPIGSTNYWKGYDPGHTMVAGKGYIALPSTTGVSLTFSGTINSGDVPVAITSSGNRFNLIGNPYPSHIAWTEAYATSKSAQIEPSIYIRTNSAGSNSSGWSYATYNASTGVAVPSHSLLTGGIIPPMQAFWVRAVASAASPLVLTSALTRSHQSLNPLKAPAIKNTDRQLVRLEVSNGTRTDETLLLVDANAADGYDAYDSPKYIEASSEVQIYTTIDTQKLVMNGMRNLPLDQEISLGFIPGTATTFSLKANEISNLPSDVKLILKDNATSIETDLTDGVSTYTFSPTTFSGDRFSLLFRSSGVSTGVSNTVKEHFSIYVNTQNEIVINAPEKAVYSVYNALGQKLLAKQISLNKTIISNQLKSGVYFVTVNNGMINNTQKVILN